jgi:glycogen(starch) synthase
VSSCYSRAVARAHARVPQSRAVRILLLAAGGAANELGAALVRTGHDVDLLTEQSLGDPTDEVRNGIRIARVPEYPPMVPREDRLAWALQLSAGMLERATRLTPADFDVIHAHGWQVAWAAAAAKNLLSAPLVSTLIDCEQARATGELDEQGKLILQAEWWLTYESRATIVPSDAVRKQIEDLFELPSRKQAVLADLADAAATLQVYERAIADEAELSRRGEERPPLRVILGRAQLGSS